MKKKQRKRLEKAWKKARKRSGHLVVVKKGKVLIIKDRRNRWTLPGGQLDAAECSAQGAIRECLEETSVKTKLLDVWHQTMEYGKGKISRIRKAIAKGAAKVRLSFEHLAAKWVSVKKATKKLIKRHAKAVLAFT
jgi:8-oxo-dGTP pyrophosphatase MutT (NUDIX family)